MVSPLRSDKPQLPDSPRDVAFEKLEYAKNLVIPGPEMLYEWKSDSLFDRQVWVLANAVTYENQTALRHLFGVCVCGKVPSKLENFDGWGSLNIRKSWCHPFNFFALEINISNLPFKTFFCSNWAEYLWLSWIASLCSQMFSCCHNCVQQSLKFSCTHLLQGTLQVKVTTVCHVSLHCTLIYKELASPLPMMLI